MRVYSIPMRTRFRGITVREGVLIDGRGRVGRVEPVPRVLRPPRPAPWLRCAEEAAAGDWPRAGARRVPVNVTVPAVPPEQAHTIVRAVGLRDGEGQGGRARADARPTTWPGSRRCATRSGPTARIRVDANGAWDVDDGGRPRSRVLDRAAGGLEYVEQPCAAVEDLAAVRRAGRRPDRGRRVDPPGRRTPTGCATCEAADIAVLKVQPLGGVRACLRIAEEIGMPVVVSSRAGDVGRDRGRGRAGGRAARAALRVRAGDRCAADRRRGDRRRCCRSTARCRSAVRPSSRGCSDRLAAAADRVAHWEARLPGGRGLVR